jgi:hypothetical protein
LPEPVKFALLRQRSGKFPDIVAPHLDIGSGRSVRRRKRVGIKRATNLRSGFRASRRREHPAARQHRIEEGLSRCQRRGALGLWRGIRLQLRRLVHVQAVGRGRRAGAQGRESRLRGLLKQLEFAADPETVDTETATRLFARATPVFAAEQVDGYQAPVSDAPAVMVSTPIEQAEAFVAATGAAINHGGGRAFYRPATDSIQLPPREVFIGSPISSPAESYYSTICHELTHWTSAEPRCNRQLGERFGDQAYAMEELVAELGAAFVCADLQITDDPRADHAQYLASWLAVLKADKKAIFTAASKATEAATFLAALQPYQPATQE